MKLLKLFVLCVWVLACGAPESDESFEDPPVEELGKGEQEYGGGSFGGTAWGTRNDTHKSNCTTGQAESEVCFFLAASVGMAGGQSQYTMGLANGFTQAERDILFGALGALAGAMDTLPNVSAFINTTVPCSTCNILLRVENISNPNPPTSNELKQYRNVTWGGCTGNLPEVVGFPENGKFRACNSVAIGLDVGDIALKTGVGTLQAKYRNVVVNAVLAGIGIGSTSGTGGTVGMRHRNWHPTPLPFNDLDDASACMLEAYDASSVNIFSMGPC